MTLAWREVMRTRHAVSAAGAREPTQDSVAVEEPLEIRVAGVAVGVLLRTPGDDEDLAMGYVLTEGVVARAQDVDRIAPCEAAPAQARGNVVDVLLQPGAQANRVRHDQPRFSSSACGVCGHAVLDHVMQHAAPLDDVHTLSSQQVLGAPLLLRALQPGFVQTGGMHAAGLLMAQGGVLHHVREDVGRHNAVDKTLGALALAGLANNARALMVSSRAGFEVVQKAHVMRVPVVITVGAPTSLAVECAQRARITLISFASNQGFSVYTHAHRVAAQA